MPFCMHKMHADEEVQLQAIALSGHSAGQMHECENDLT